MIILPIVQDNQRINNDAQYLFFEKENPLVVNRTKNKESGPDDAPVSKRFHKMPKVGLNIGSRIHK